MKKVNKKTDDSESWLNKVVVIEALDWLLYVDAVTRTENFAPMPITLYGLVVACDAVSLTVAPQVYADDRVRCAQCLPLANIVSIKRLKSKGLEGK